MVGVYHTAFKLTLLFYDSLTTLGALGEHLNSLLYPRSLSQYLQIDHLIFFGFPRELLFRGNNSRMGRKELLY